MSLWNDDKNYSFTITYRNKVVKKTKSACCNAKVIDAEADLEDNIHSLFCSKCGKLCEEKEPIFKRIKKYFNTSRSF